MGTTQDRAEPNGNTPSLGSVLTATEFGKSTVTVEQAAEQALRKRPTLSIRTRLLLGFSIFFLLSLAISGWSYRLVSDVQDRITFLEVADDLTMEIQHARRCEKNFLLYGTGLAEAVEHAQRAQELTRANHDNIRRVMGAEAVWTVEEHLAKYEELLGRIGAARPEERADHEAALRMHGGETLDFATSFVTRERTKVDLRLDFAQKLHLFFIVALLVLIVLVANFTARRITSTLKRFMVYTKRIGAGDFTPITPVRRYRDEFSQLAVAINRMIHELDRRHQILVQSHKLRALGTLVAGVAHELNNPLNNIMLTAGVLKEEFNDLSDDEKLEMVDELMGQTDRSRKIVRNLLDYARESEAEIEPIDLTKTVRETATLLGNQLKVKKVRLKLDLPESVPPVHGDRQLLGEVFMNLIINALDVLPEKSEIRIEVDDERRDGFLAVDVSDDGPGIPEHVIDRIFDPFFTTKPRGKGTGLGLSVARGIVKKLGGDLLVKSRVGEGATFTVLLPITGIPSDLSARG